MSVLTAWPAPCQVLPRANGSSQADASRDNNSDAPPPDHNNSNSSNNSGVTEGSLGGAEYNNSNSFGSTGGFGPSNSPNSPSRLSPEPRVLSQLDEHPVIN